MNDSERFVDFLIGLNNRIKIDKIASDAKACILDYLGCTFAGHTIMKKRLHSLGSLLCDSGKVPIIGAGRTASPSSAALINAMSAHCAELDDGHRFGMLHLEAPLLSALVSAAGAKMIVDGNKFLRGLAMGCEAACRLAEAMQPGHKILGFHATGTCGVIGSALGIGFAVGASREQLLNALSASAASASGLLEMIDSPSQLKPYNVGNAAMGGFVAFCMAKSGFLGPSDPLFGERGFYNAFADNVNRDALWTKESELKLLQRYTKPYAACRHCHPAIEGALTLCNQYDIKPESIARVDVETYKLAIKGHSDCEINSISAAKMSTPFSVATAIFNRSAGIAEFDDKNINNKTISNIARCVNIAESEKYTSLFPQKRGATVTIKLCDGKMFSADVDYPLGEPENPMSEKQIRDKYYQLGAFSGIDSKKLDIIYKAVYKIDSNLIDWLNVIQQ